MPGLGTEEKGREVVLKSLLSALRRCFEAPELGYAEAPQRLTGGYENELFSLRLTGHPEGALQDPLVVRIFPSYETLARARRELVIHQSVVEQGFSAPRVFGIGSGVASEEGVAGDGTAEGGLPIHSPAAANGRRKSEGEGDGRAFLVMERCSGSPMLEALGGLSLLPLRLPKLMAETAVRLHRLDPSRLVAALEDAGEDPDLLSPAPWEAIARRRVVRFELEAFVPLEAWLDRHRPEPRRRVITHGDLHPLNLMVDGGKVSALLDWTRTALAPPEFELASNRILIGYGPVGFSSSMQHLFNVYRQWFLNRFESHYRKHLRVDDDLVAYYEVWRAFSALAGVAARRRGRVLQTDPPEIYPFDSSNLPRLIARVERLTGIRLELPPKA